MFKDIIYLFFYCTKCVYTILRPHRHFADAFGGDLLSRIFLQYHRL